MKKIFIFILFFFLSLNFEANSKENFFQEAKKKYEEEKLNDSKFLFQRNIVFNPKDAKSYLYLAKIYNFQENEIEEIKNLETTLLLEPDNEEALYMLMKVNLKKSNFSEVKNLKKKFKIVCSSLCDKTKDINEGLKNLEAEKDSKQ
tara:strand:+ start:35 stop:472 length:438 start_codon:yes stop_codon:yes gene_type:complete